MEITNNKINYLKLYWGDPCEINNSLILYQPTIGDIIELDEQAFYGTVGYFTTNPTEYRVSLWEHGIDWNKLSDYELFAINVKLINQEYSKYLFKDIDFSLFEIVPRENVEEGKCNFSLYNKEQQIEINEETYELLALYIRTMFNMFPKVEKAKGKTTKQWIIEEERQKQELEKAEKAKQGTQSILLPLVSACLNHPGFKYTKPELKNVGIVEFMDSVQRLQVYESTTALLRGMYSGMVNTKEINKEEFNFMRDIHK